ncbi:low temperature requirement protein A [Actinomadura algeriensis]|uniref:Low temperature requirement protein LtrA n=1 Tax=Actinomadura algeriensis TaxID=1679523 RepID=A0ABR9JQ07_9ACTN|nr:low temperature requirement protein A [Actinomadura algeriensis]MBE1532659.1 low temperature requirement protein LtrA [Actinomadura algeriensis]
MTSSPTPTDEEEVYGVTTLELFFDLVFVFTLIRLTDVLIGEFSPLGLFQIVLMFGVLWWMYGGYAWLTNMTAPKATAHRLLILAGMGGFFMVAIGTPTAFTGGGGLVWGLGYLLLVLAHVTLYARGNPNILRVLPANLLAAALIIAAGLLDGGPAVYVLWTIALVVPIVQPYIVPAGGLFRIRPEHIVERHGLLVMITLGESIISVGTGAAHAHLDAGLVVAALLGLALAAAIWWTYFTGDDERAEETLAAADDARRTQMTMFGYFYAHIPLIVGVLVTAAGMKKAVEHAWEHLKPGTALAIAGGVALYLAGDVLFRRIMRIGPSRIRLAAAAASLATIPLGLWLATAEIAALIAILTTTVLLERRSPAPSKGNPASHHPSPAPG